MKSMKLFISVITLFLFTSSAMAQHAFSDNKTPEERAKVQTEWMQTELSLDSTQIEKVYQINLKYANKLDGIKNSSEDRMQKFKKFKALSSDKDKDLKKVFSNEQFKIYQKKKDELRSKMKNRRNN